MKWILIAIGVLAIVYLVFVIPAGIAVWISEIKFKKSPHRATIIAIINDKWITLQKADETKVKDIIKNGIREIVIQNGQEYSIDITGSNIGDKKYKIIISAGILKPIVIGHAKKFIMNYTEHIK